MRWAAVVLAVALGGPPTPRGAHAFSLWVAPSLRAFLAAETPPHRARPWLAGREGGGGGPSSPHPRHRPTALVALPGRRSGLDGPPPLAASTWTTALHVGGLFFAAVELETEDGGYCDGDGHGDEASSLVQEMATYLAVRLSRTLLQSIKGHRSRQQPQILGPPSQQPQPQLEQPQPQPQPDVRPEIPPAAAAEAAPATAALSAPEALTPVAEASVDAGERPRSLHKREGDRVVALGDDFSAEPAEPAPAAAVVEPATSDLEAAAAAEDDGHVGDANIVSEAVAEVPRRTGTLEVSSSSSSFPPPAAAAVAGLATVHPPPVPPAVSLDFGRPLEVEATLPLPSLPAEPTEGKAPAVAAALEGTAPTADVAAAEAELRTDSVLDPEPGTSPLPAADVVSSAVDDDDSGATVENPPAEQEGDESKESTFFALETLANNTLDGDESSVAAAASAGPEPEIEAATATATPAVGEAGPVAGSGFVLHPPTTATPPSSPPASEAREPEPAHAAGRGIPKRRTANATTESKTSTALSGAALIDAEVASSASAPSAADEEDDVDLQRRLLVETFSRSPDALGPGFVHEQSDGSGTGTNESPRFEAAAKADPSVPSPTLDVTTAEAVPEVLEASPEAIELAAEEMVSPAAEPAVIDVELVSTSIPSAAEGAESVATVTHEAPPTAVDKLQMEESERPKALTSNWSPVGQSGKAPRPNEPDLAPTVSKESQSLNAAPSLVDPIASVDGAVASAVNEPTALSGAVSPHTPSTADVESSWISVSIESDDRGTIAESVVPVDSPATSSSGSTKGKWNPYQSKLSTKANTDDRSEDSPADDTVARSSVDADTKNKWNPFHSGKKASSEIPASLATDDPARATHEDTTQGSRPDRRSESIFDASDVAGQSAATSNVDKDRWNPYSKSAKSGPEVFDPWKAWMSTMVDSKDKSAALSQEFQQGSAGASKINYSGFGSKHRTVETRGETGYLGGLRADSTDSHPMEPTTEANSVEEPEPQAFPIKLADGREVTYHRVADETGRGFRWEVDAEGPSSEAPKKETQELVMELRGSVDSSPMLVDDRRTEASADAFSLGYRWTGSNWASSTLKPVTAKPPSLKDYDPMELHPLYRTKSGGYVWYTIPKYPEIPNWKTFAKYSGIHWTHPEHEEDEYIEDADC